MLDPSCVLTSVRMSSAVCAKQKHTGAGFASALAPTWQITSRSLTTSSPRKKTISHAGFGQYRHRPATVFGRCARTGVAPTSKPGSPLNGHKMPAVSSVAQHSLTRRPSPEPIASQIRPSSLSSDRWPTGRDGSPLRRTDQTPSARADTTSAAHTPKPRPATAAEAPPVSSDGSAQHNTRPPTPMVTMPDAETDRRRLATRQSSGRSGFTLSP